MTTTEIAVCEASWDNCDGEQPHYCARPMGHRGNHECECGEEIAPCGARYPGSGPGARIVACDLAAGHDGEHEELATESTWPRREPADPTDAEIEAEIEAGAEVFVRAFPFAHQNDTWPQIVERHAAFVDGARRAARAMLTDHDARVRVPLLSLIADLADDGPCHYDHNGYCQAHSLDLRPCPHERAKRVLARQHATPPTTEGTDH